MSNEQPQGTIADFLAFDAGNCDRLPTVWRFQQWQSSVRAARAAVPVEPADFDAEGFRSWVLANLPDDTIIGNSAWWADHLTAWAKRFAHPAPQPQQAGVATDQQKTEFVLRELMSALNAMLTFFGMDEDENSKATFDKARQAYNYAEIVTRPLEPWERQSLNDFRRAVHGWHEKAVEKGFDGVEAMCELAAPAAMPPPTAPAPQAQAVPAGFSLRRQEDGRIVVKAPIGWCIVANTGQASGIDSMILWSLADAMLSASAAQKEPT